MIIGSALAHCRIISEKPRFARQPDDHTGEVGTDVQFACKVTGDPMPVIVWKKKDGKMPLGRAQIMENKSLRIDRCVVVVVRRLLIALIYTANLP